MKIQSLYIYMFKASWDFMLKDFGVIYEKNNLTNSWIILTWKVISGSELKSQMLFPLLIP